MNKKGLNKDLLYCLFMFAFLVICGFIIFGAMKQSNQKICIIQTVEKNVTLDINNPQFRINSDRIDGLVCEKQVNVKLEEVCNQYGYCENFTVLSSNTPSNCIYKVNEEICQ